MRKGHVDVGGVLRELVRHEDEALSSGRMPACLCSEVSTAGKPKRKSG